MNLVIAPVSVWEYPAPLSHAERAAVKYCIGCIHLWFEPGQEAQYGSTWTGKYADTEQGEFACHKGHWRRKLDEHSSSPTRPKALGEDITYELQKRMEQAETCSDFVEREIPDSYRV